MVRTILWILCIALLGWIGYVVYTMTNWKNTLDPAAIFSQKDDQVIVIHKPNSYDWNQIEFSTLAENKNCIDPILPFLPAKCDVYISKKRNLILIESPFPWSNLSINQLLSKANLRYSIQSDSYKIEQFNAVFKNNRILIYKYEEDVEGVEFDFSQLDRNATASIATLSTSKTNFIDIYLKNENTIEYHSKNAQGIKGKLIEDQSIFQSYIPLKAENYCFFESTYLKSIDPVFAKSPMSKWVDAGFVSFSIDNKRVFMCQFVEGQNMVQNLNEYLQRTEDNTLVGEYTALEIAPKIGATRGNYVVKTIDNIAIFSSDTDVVDVVLSEIELNKTWVYNDEDLTKLMDNLPKSVSYRSLGKFKNVAISVMGDKIIQTEVKYKAEKLSLNTDLEYISVSISGKINDFIAFQGKGNIVCVTEQGLIQGIENSVKTWKKSMGSNVIGELQMVKSNDQEFIVATSNNSIHVITKKGKYKDGFPVKASNGDFICQANAFVNKGQIMVGIINNKNELIIYDSKGSVSKKITLSDKDKWNQLDFYMLGTDLYVTIKGESKVIVYSFADKKIQFQYPLSNKLSLVDKPNASLGITPINGALELIDFTKGKDKEKSKTKVISEMLVHAVWMDSSLYTISMNASKLIFSTNLNEVLFEKEFGNARMFSASIYKNSFKETYFSVVDGNENNVYLYDSKGRTYVKGVIEGSKKVSLNQTAGFSITLTTIVDGYLVQYFVK